jgi:hypothetical protein
MHLTVVNQKTCQRTERESMTAASGKWNQWTKTQAGHGKTDQRKRNPKRKTQAIRWQWKMTPGLDPVGGASKRKSERASSKAKIGDWRTSWTRSSDLFTCLKKTETNHCRIHALRQSENGQRPWARREGFDPAAGDLRAEGTGDSGKTKYKSKSQALPCQLVMLQGAGHAGRFQRLSRWRTKILSWKWWTLPAPSSGKGQIWPTAAENEMEIECASIGGNNRNRETRNEKMSNKKDSGGGNSARDSRFRDDKKITKHGASADFIEQTNSETIDLETRTAQEKAKQFIHRNWTRFTQNTEVTVLHPSFD